MKQTYKILHKAYGKQGWWPIINNKSLLCEYHKNTPKNEQERFEILIGSILTQNTQWYPNVVRAIQQLKLGRQLTKQEQEELREAEISHKKISGNNKIITKGKILTQNTSWNNVEKAIFNLNKANMLSADKLRKAPLEKIASLIKPAGYYNQKAARLKIIADYFLKNKNVFKKNAKEMRNELLKVKGIGSETADSIVLYAFEKPSFVIDAYTRRIFSRLGLCNENDKYEAVQELFESRLPSDVSLFKEYHALIVEHAKRHCRKKPSCEVCVLRKGCGYCR